MDVVLVEPEIPQNTGSIARTCAATATPLHLIGPLGFVIDERRVRRAGLDYWPFVNLTQHASWDEYLRAAAPEKVWLFSKFGSRQYTDVQFGASDALVFGSETRGLAAEFVARFAPEQLLRIPIAQPAVRSLNLSNAVSVALYEARRQLGLDSETPAHPPRTHS